MEDKERICKLFTPVLRECRSHHDLDYLKYDLLIDKETGDYSETVTAVISDPTGENPPKTKEIDVTADSGVQMIKDILKALG